LAPPPSGQDSSAAAPESLFAAGDSLSSPPAVGTTGAHRTPTKPPSPAPPDTGQGAALAIQDWFLDGKTLDAETGPEGQVIRVEAPVITHGTTRITALRGRFEVDADRAVLEGDVRLEDGGLRGTAGQARYYRAQELLLAEGGVSMETDTLRVRGEEGTYNRADEIIFLRGKVHGWRGSRRITADEAEWFRRSDEVFFRGNASVVDTVENTTLSGERIRYDLAHDRVEVLESPRLLLSTGGENPIRITGERLRVDPAGNAEAVGAVEIARGGVVAASDSAYFSRDRRIAFLFGDPRVTERDGTLTGDSLRLHFDESDVLTLVEMHGNAGLRFEPQDSTRQGEVSTVRGDSLTMYFAEETADRVVVFGNAQSTYRPSPEDRSEGVGTNDVTGDSITIVLDEGRVDRVRVTGGAKGTFQFGQPPEGKGEPDSLAAPETAPAAESKPQKVIYSAREVEYSLDDRTVDLFQDADLEYGQLHLTAGKVRFYAGRRYLEAEGKPVLVDRSGGTENRVDGTQMDYNLDSREGTIQGGRTRSEDGFIYSERLRQVGESEFMARGGDFTTCDRAEHGEKPHFHFTSKRMKIYLDDKVVAKPVVFYIRDIPILAIPYYVFSIRKGRHSGLLMANLDLGISSTSGRFIRNLGYYWAASQYWDLTLTTDYSENPSRFVGRGLARYAKRYLMNGTLSVAKTLASDQDQYDVVGAHQMTLGEWRLTARAEFRDREFRRDEPLGPDFGARVDRKLLSDASLSRSFPFGASFFLTFRREQDLDAELKSVGSSVLLNETLPQYSFSLNSRPLGRVADGKNPGRVPALASVRLAFNSSGSSVHTVTQRRAITVPDSTGPDTTVSRNDERRSQARHILSLTDTRRILGALNLSPRIQVNESWVDREFSATDTTMGFHRAATWLASVGASSALYGTLPGLGPVLGLRHTLRPSAGLTYQPEFESLTVPVFNPTDSSTVLRPRFPGVSAREEKFLSVGIDQSFQAKVRSGETSRRVDLFHWSLGASYDFLAKDQGRRGWSSVNSNLDLSQVYGVGLGFNSSHDPYEKFRAQTFQLTTGYSLSGQLPGGGDEPEEKAGGNLEGSGREELEARGADLALRDRPGTSGSRGDALTWNAGFSVSYAGVRDADALNTTASVNARGSVRLTRNWSADYNMRWDATEGKILGNNLSLTRKLHCWEAQFSRSELGSDTTFYFRLQIAGMPDIRYEQGRQGGTSIGSLTQFLP
jgi:lipopolysaccharide assembly outer membrane protein LptD (OstA)